MAISSGDLIEKFGTQDTVSASGGTSSVSDNSFSVEADAEVWTNDDNAPQAGLALTIQKSAGTWSGSIGVFVRLMNIDGTTDEGVIDSANERHYLGGFEPDSNQVNATDQTYGLRVALPNTVDSQAFEFYLENQTGISIASGWVLKVTPITAGPKA